jgi:drug/metabolite transporter (DMT)-like permease
MSDNLRGVLLMCLAMFAFTINDTFMKAASLELPLFQAIFLRGLATTVLLLVLAQITQGKIALRPATGDGRRLALRTGAEVGASVAFLTALTHMPLANLSAIMQALPLAIALAAAAFLGASLGWRRLSAIFVGFVGVLFIVKPGTDGFDIWSLMGLTAVGFVVVRDLSTSKLSRATSSVVVSIWSAGCVTILGAAVMIWHGWQDVTWHNLAMTTGASLALVVGYMASVMVMRVGDIAVVAPFRYTALIWAIFFGWVLFGTLPDGLTLIGAVIVVLSGIYTIWREARRKSNVIIEQSKVQDA